MECPDHTGGALGPSADAGKGAGTNWQHDGAHCLSTKVVHDWGSEQGEG